MKKVKHGSFFELPAPDKGPVNYYKKAYNIDKKKDGA